MFDKQTPQTQTQVCSIRIGFPVESDEQAIEYKKRISEVLADISKARIDFNLVTVPMPDNNGS